MGAGRAMTAYGLMVVLLGLGGCGEPPPAAGLKRSVGEEVSVILDITEIKCRIGGKDVTLERLGLVALHGSAPDPASELREFISFDQDDIAALEAFRSVGWHFLEHKEASRLRDEAQRIEPGATVARVYRGPSGRLVIGTNLLSVKLSEEIDDKSAQELLGSLGLKVLRGMGFSPNLFEVEVTDGRDAVEAACEIGNLEAVDYAEPVLIERIEGRGR